VKVLLVGNYENNRQQSMQRFAEIMRAGLAATGHEVRLVRPPVVLGRLRRGATGLGKWLGYFDRFFLFRRPLKKAAQWADVIHICDHANAVYVPWIIGKPHIVTCHDMLAIRSALGEIPEHKTGLTGKVYQRWILSGLKRARHIACVSSATRDDLLRLAGMESERTLVIQNGLNYPYRRMSAEEKLFHLHEMGLAKVRPFLLHVGSNNWYKNRNGLLRIFHRMVHFPGSQKWTLLLVGPRLPGASRTLARKMGLADRIVELQNVTNSQLCALYSAAEALIFPSLAEGFGWPIIEAQACGCPVFASNRRPMTEVGGDAAVYFEPTNEEEAAEIIHRALRDKGQLHHMRDSGLQNAGKYSAKNMVSGYVRAYRLAAYSAQFTIAR